MESFKICLFVEKRMQQTETVWVCFEQLRTLKINIQAERYRNSVGEGERERKRGKDTKNTENTLSKCVLSFTSRWRSERIEGVEHFCVLFFIFKTVCVRTLEQTFFTHTSCDVVSLSTHRIS